MINRFICRREEAGNRPKVEFVPKTLTDLNIEGISAGTGDGVNGTQNNHHGTSVIRATQSNQITRNTKTPVPNYYKSTPPLIDPWSLPPQGILSCFYFVH